MKVGEKYEAVELKNARPEASVHLREAGKEHTFCGRNARGARVLPKLNEEDFDPYDPDIALCRRCWYLSRYHSGSLTYRSIIHKGVIYLPVEEEARK